MRFVHSVSVCRGSLMTTYIKKEREKGGESRIKYEESFRKRQYVKTYKNVVLFVPLP